ncbi:unnamed protein product [Prunus armeniaca]|uniref:Uncharacterized protein n=1 Tax=Prunus armeniaca TaxID=36596 RepID=A0A6J5XVR5_PRUAR|nr:unnamed protein product [Prunus armeniaca]
MVARSFEADHNYSTFGVSALTMTPTMASKKKHRTVHFNGGGWMLIFCKLFAPINPHKRTAVELKLLSLRRG